MTQFWPIIQIQLVCILFYTIISILLVVAIRSYFTVWTKLTRTHEARLSCRFSCSKTLLNIIIACSMWYIYTTLSSRVFAQQLHSYKLYLTIISLTSFEFMFADLHYRTNTHIHRVKKAQILLNSLFMEHTLMSVLLHTQN